MQGKTIVKFNYRCTLQFHPYHYPSINISINKQIFKNDMVLVPCPNVLAPNSKARRSILVFKYVIHFMEMVSSTNSTKPLKCLKTSPWSLDNWSQHIYNTSTLQRETIVMNHTWKHHGIGANLMKECTIFNIGSR